MPHRTYLTIYQSAKINIKKYTCNNILNKQTNIERFPDDFLFVLTREEANSLIAMGYHKM